MSSKKDVTFENLNQDLNAVEQEKQKDIKKISNIFGKIQNSKSIKNEEIEALFSKAINVSSEKSWEFLIETYSRFYNRYKVKKQKEIIRLIDSEIIRRLDNFVESKQIDSIILSLERGNNNIFLEELIGKIEEWQKCKNYVEQEAIAYLYIYFLIAIRRTLSKDTCISTIAKERKLFLSFVKHDRYASFINDITKDLCKELTKLYGESDEKLLALRDKYIKQEEDISSKKIEIAKMDQKIKDSSVEISNLKDDILHLNCEISKKKQEVTDKENKISELEVLINRTNDRNDYNENLYKQQFLTLKRNFIDKLKKELQLEIDGLEDIADTLAEVQKEKLQRRIDRICKILQKVGE